MITQRTIKKITKIEGVGLHTGCHVNVVFRPAAVNSGIIYRRVDMNPPSIIKLGVQAIRSSILCSSIANFQEVSIATIEHLQAALAGLGIDNLIIDVNGPELPILDGSAAPFVNLLLKAGIKEYQVAKKFFCVTKHVRVEDNEKWFECFPYHGFSLDLIIDFDHQIINEKTRHYFFNFSTQGFIQQISQARTFGFMRDIKQSQEQGLCLGGSLDCAILLDDHGVINESGLRFADELVRHKVLDVIGDLFICGYNIIGAFKAFKTGHALNHSLLKNLFASKNAWKMVTFYKTSQSPYDLNLPMHPLN